MERSENHEPKQKTQPVQPEWVKKARQIIRQLREKTGYKDRTPTNPKYTR